MTERPEDRDRYAAELREDRGEHDYECPCGETFEVRTSFEGDGLHLSEYECGWCGAEVPLEAFV